MNINFQPFSLQFSPILSSLRRPVAVLGNLFSDTFGICVSRGLGNSKFHTLIKQQIGTIIIDECLLYLLTVVLFHFGICVSRGLGNSKFHTLIKQQIGTIIVDECLLYLLTVLLFHLCDSFAIRNAALVQIRIEETNLSHYFIN
jgi:hypothetical protein